MSKVDEREDLHPVVAEAEFETGDHVLVDIEGIEIAVYNTPDGYHAISNYCIHQGGPLCEGPIEGTVVENEAGELEYDHEGKIVSCPWHGWEFDVTTGEHLYRSDYSQPTFDVEVHDEVVYIRW